MSQEFQIDLSDLPGMGPVRRAALADAGVRDLQGLLALRMADLAAIRSIGHWQARRIREFLRQRGLLLAGDEESGEPTVVVEVRSRAEAEALSASLQAMQDQAEAEARIEAEVEALAVAVAQAQHEADAQDGRQERAGRRAAAAKKEQVRVEHEGVGEQEQGHAGEGQESALADSAVAVPAAADGSLERVAALREQLPEAALALMEAIRQAAVCRTLTRQVTRLLIVAGEFAADGRPVSKKQREAAAGVLKQSERLLQRAVERQRLTPRDQKELARRLRRRRKELEVLLAAGRESHPGE